MQIMSLDSDGRGFLVGDPCMDFGVHAYCISLDFGESSATCVLGLGPKESAVFGSLKVNLCFFPLSTSKCNPKVSGHSALFFLATLFAYLKIITVVRKKDVKISHQHVYSRGPEWLEELFFRS